MAHLVRSMQEVLQALDQLLNKTVILWTFKMMEQQQEIKCTMLVIYKMMVSLKTATTFQVAILDKSNWIISNLIKEPQQLIIMELEGKYHRRIWIRVDKIKQTGMSIIILELHLQFKQIKMFNRQIMDNLMCIRMEFNQELAKFFLKLNLGNLQFHLIMSTLLMLHMIMDMLKPKTNTVSYKLDKPEELSTQQALDKEQLQIQQAEVNINNKMI